MSKRRHHHHRETVRCIPDWRILYHCNQHPHFGVYSITPPASIRPRLTLSPFARIKSSIVFNLPSSVLSLNQPRWSAMRCLKTTRELAFSAFGRCWSHGTCPSRRETRRVDTTGTKYVDSPVLTAWTLHNNDTPLVTSSCKFVSRTCATISHRAGEGDGETRLLRLDMDVRVCSNSRRCGP